jgi:hypothetical protein
MPRVVVVAATLQLLQAVAFLVQSLLAYRHGANAQRAAEAEVAKQGLPAEVLAQNGVRFSESGAELVLPVAIVACLATLASLNLAGVEVGRISTWILQPIFLVAAGFVTANQVFAVRFLRSAFDKSGDPTLQGINVPAFVDAAMGAFPAWFRYLVVARFALVTVGSGLVIVLLTVPAANSYFQ